MLTDLNAASQVHALHKRTNIQVVVFATRIQTSQYLRPFVITTSPLAADFFQMTLGETVSDIAVRMEAFCLSGVKGAHFATLHRHSTN